MAMMLAGGPAKLVRLKPATALTPATLAVTVNPPAIEFAVNVGAFAMPLAFVAAVAVADPLKAALAAVAGAANVTSTPLTGFPLASFTRACRAVPNAVFTVALCGAPALDAMLAGGGSVFVREKFAAADTPVTVAVTM